MSNKRKCLTIGEKVQIIQSLERGAKNVEICRKYSLSSSTVSTLWKNRVVYLSALEGNLSRAKKIRKCDVPNVDEALIEWFFVQRSAGFAIDGPILKTQAEKFAAHFGRTDFVCNNGWLDRFKNRHNIVYAKITGESRSADPVISNDWISSVWADLRTGYKDEDIYNADETGFFYNMTPDTTFKFKGEKYVRGKTSKNRLTVLVCANMTGTDKRKLFVIGKSTKLRCYKHKNKFPVDYTANKKAGMTTDIFRKYINDWNKELFRKSRKILLLVDNSPAHPNIENLTNIKLVFLPPNMTSSILQPMDMGIIKTLKGFYKRFVVLHRISQRKLKRKESVSVLDAINLLNDAWNQVTSKTISNCFIKFVQVDHNIFICGLPTDIDIVNAVSEQIQLKPVSTIANNKLISWVPSPTHSDIVNVVLKKEYASDVEIDTEQMQLKPVPIIADNLFICGVPTDGDIVDAVVKKEYASDEEIETEQVQLKPVPTIAEANEAIDTLMIFFENCDTNSEILQALRVVRENLRNIKV